MTLHDAYLDFMPHLCNSVGGRGNPEIADLFEMVFFLGAYYTVLLTVEESHDADSAMESLLKLFHEIKTRPLELEARRVARAAKREAS